MADDMRRLLDHIVRRFVVRDELVGIDLDASASDRAESIDADKRRAIRREIERAEELADAFHRGLARASALGRGGASELVLDDRRADENAIADAMIHFLVSYDLASSRSEETEPLHYRYAITVDWDRLRAVAREAGVDLDQSVRRAP